MKRYVDTNVLVRIMTNDVPAMAEEALREIQESGKRELVILDAVLGELFFVLENNPLYRFPRDVIVPLFTDVLTAPQFVVSERAKHAFRIYSQKPKLDFTDCLLAARADMKRQNILTFDKNLQKVLH